MARQKKSEKFAETIPRDYLSCETNSLDYLGRLRNQEGKMIEPFTLRHGTAMDEPPPF